MQILKTFYEAEFGSVWACFDQYGESGTFQLPFNSLQLLFSCPSILSNQNTWFGLLYSPVESSQTRGMFNRPTPLKAPEKPKFWLIVPKSRGALNRPIFLQVRRSRRKTTVGRFKGTIFKWLFKKTHTF